MKKTVLIALAAMLALSSYAQETKVKIYGFIRNYAHVDSHEMKAGTADLFSYLPTDTESNDATFHFTAITSRLGVDVSGYKAGNMSVGAKIETDFYSGLSGVTGTATLRLRQAYMTMGWAGENGNSSILKVGQAWHPMAADMPDVFSLNTGAPFGPFSRTPLAQFDCNFGSGLSLTLAGIWQMQYTSAGPVYDATQKKYVQANSADFMKNCGIPEIYAGISYKSSTTVLRAGLDVLTISPDKKNTLTTVTPFLYAQYKKDNFSIKAKSVFAQAGEHVNLNGGYALASGTIGEAGAEYTPTRNSSSWVSLSYGKEWQTVLFGGYVRNFGTVKEIGDASLLWFSKNSFAQMNSMYRITPAVIRNIGKVAIGLEYELTSVQYGDKTKFNAHGLADQGLHWVTNHRVQAMLKYTF